jgi:hypothetical protein
VASYFERLRRLEATLPTPVGDAAERAASDRLGRSLHALVQAMSGPEIVYRMQALGERLEAGAATDDDLQMLAGLPDSGTPPAELVRMLLDAAASC